MPGLTNPAMIAAADGMRAAMRYAQMHWAAAGAAGTSNLATSGRQPVTWAPATLDGDFGLASPINFTGGAPNSGAYSVTLWSAPAGGTFYGEFLTLGDSTFNASGQYSVTAINFDGSASWDGQFADDPRARANVTIVLPNPGERLYPILRPVRRAMQCQ